MLKCIYSALQYFQNVFKYKKAHNKFYLKTCILAITTVYTDVYFTKKNFILRGECVLRENSNILAVCEIRKIGEAHFGINY